VSKRKPEENKAKRKGGGALDRAVAARVETVSRDQDVLERNANIGSDGYDSSHRIAVCYNRACPDYRRVRQGSEKCGCVKKSVGSLT
jgi:hypothetical protein